MCCFGVVLVVVMYGDWLVVVYGCLLFYCCVEVDVEDCVVVVVWIVVVVVVG